MSNYKIAIPEVNGMVNEHFGQSTNFSVVEITEDRVVGVTGFSTEAHNHEGLAILLKEKQVVSVIAGRIGPHAEQALTDAGIKVYSGATGSIADVAAYFAKGSFESQPSCGNHGGCGCHHDH